MTVDTLSIARELRAAAIPDAQAEAIAAAIGRSAMEDMSNLATKADLGQLERASKADLAQLERASKADLSQLESRIDVKLEQLRSSLIMWFVATNLTMAAIIIAASKL